jgi:hypothetical protein
MMIDLKSCPLCGKLPELKSFDYDAPDSSDDSPTREWWIECRCGLDFHVGLSADALIATWNRRASLWIDVRERLPEANHKVLVADCYGNVEFTHMRDCGKWFLFSNDTVTHWRPLPEPPEEDV